VLDRRSAPEGDEYVNVALLIETDGPGGAEQVVAHLAAELALAGATVTVLVPAGGEGWIRERLRGSTVAIEEVPLAGPVSLKAIAAVTRVLRRHRIQLLHTHEFGQSFVGACAAQVARSAHLITMHGGRYYAERWRRRFLLRTAVALSGAITAVSATLADDIEQTLRLRRGRVARIPNGARPAPGGSNGIRRALGIPPEAPLLLAVGNLYPVKGHRHLLAALAILGDRTARPHLAIAGRGIEEGALRAQAEAAALSDRVHLLGLRSDVGALLRSADLFVHPSLAEGLPLAVLEAMFAASPIIATSVGELPAVLEDGRAGVLVPPGDPAALAQAIRGLLTDRRRARELGARAASRVRREFGINRMVARYNRLYETITGRSLRA
jgi:glycosyltransferase involved in cell wall biosynthesis